MSRTSLLPTPRRLPACPIDRMPRTGLPFRAYHFPDLLHQLFQAIGIVRELDSRAGAPVCVRRRLLSESLHLYDRMGDLLNTRGLLLAPGADGVHQRFHTHGVL